MLDLKDDLVRAQALTEILCGAAHADDELDVDEAASLATELCALLGISALSPELERHIRSFNRQRFDPVDAAQRLRLADLPQKQALMRAVRAIIKADAITRDTERDYFTRLAHILRLAPSDID